MIFPVTDIAALTEAHLQALITDQVAEGREVDYKLMLPGSRDQDKVEFLADLVSFANTSGGHLVFGMAEEQLLPTALPGLIGVDWDATIGRLEGWAASGIEPRIPRLAFRAVPFASGAHALVIAIPHSTAYPHRLKVNDLHRFYARNSRGKYLLDIQEVRALFAQAERFPELLRQFRTKRLAAFAGGEAPMPPPDGPLVVLHVVPTAAVTGRFQLDPVTAVSATNRSRHAWLQPLGASGWNTEYNFDGVCTTSAGTYLQLFRDGAMEIVSATVLDQGYIPGTYLCDALVDQLGRALEFYRALQVAPPLAVLLSMVSVRDLGFAAEGGMRAAPLARDTLFFPAIPIENLGADSATVLRPTFDALWQTFGYARCPHYDAGGVYQRRR